MSTPEKRTQNQKKLQIVRDILRKIKEAQKKDEKTKGGNK